MENNKQSYEMNGIRSVNSIISHIRNQNKQTYLANNLTKCGAKEMESFACNAAQKLFLMRHAERMDVTFGPWVSHCFDDNGNYTRKDLNMPLTLPKRKLGSAGYISDTPLTQMGIYQSIVIGEGLKAADAKIEHVYCSPSLRCIQTCDGVLRGLGKKDEIKIRIEPALMDWLGWSNQKLPDWMTAEELTAAGYNIDTSYRPCMSKDDFIGTTDTHERYFERQSKIVKRVLASHPIGNILFVGHVLTFKGCIKELVGDFEASLDELLKGVEHVPYASLQALSKNGDKWEIVKSPMFSLTHSSNIRFDNNVIF